MTDVEFERCAAVLTSLHASHNLPHYLTAAGIIRHPSHVEVRYRGDLASFDSNELTRLVMAAHRWRVRVALSGRAKGVITVRLHPREATGTSIERHPSLADFQAQLAATTDGALTR